METNDPQTNKSTTGFTTAREEVRHFTVRLSSSPAFFPEMCNFLSLTLQMQYVLIGHLTGNKPESVLTVGISAHGQPSPNIEYELSGTPCENVIGRNLCYYPLNVANLFPTDKILKDLKIQSYLGIPLNGPKGQPLGLISVFSKHPIENVLLVEQVLEEVKPRCEQELTKHMAKYLKARSLKKHLN